MKCGDSCEPVLTIHDKLPRCGPRYVRKKVVEYDSANRKTLSLKKVEQWHCTHSVICRNCRRMLQSTASLCPDKPEGMLMIGEDVAKIARITPYSDLSQAMFSRLNKWEAQPQPFPLDDKITASRGHLDSDNFILLLSTQEKYSASWNRSMLEMDYVRNLASERGKFNVKIESKEDFVMDDGSLWRTATWRRTTSPKLPRPINKKTPLPTTAVRHANGQFAPSFTEQAVVRAEETRKEVLDFSDNHIVIEWNPQELSQNAASHIARGRGRYSTSLISKEFLENGNIRAVWGRTAKEEK